MARMTFRAPGLLLVLNISLYVLLRLMTGTSVNLADGGKSMDV